MAGGVAAASLNGTLELLVLSAAGGYLAHLGVLRGGAVVTLSTMMVEVLIPALMYLSVLEGLRAALETRTSSTLAAVFFPPVWGLVVPIVGGVAALGTVRLVARDKPDAVQRVVMLCIAMGNSGNMPLLILTALCDNFEPFMKDAKCVSEAASLSMLYCITWNILLWSPMFACLASARDEPAGSAECGLLSTGTAPKAERPGFFSPPFVAILCALGTALIPGLPSQILDKGVLLSPITSAVRLVSDMAVPTSSLIVGARLYESQVKEKNPDEKALFVPERKRFGIKVHLSILAMRMIVLPFVGRMIYKVTQMWRIPGQMLRVFSLIEMAVPSANATVMVTVLLSQFLPNIGPQLEADVAATILYQYAVVPVFFTVNTALALNLVYNEHN